MASSIFTASKAFGGARIGFNPTNARFLNHTARMARPFSSFIINPSELHKALTSTTTSTSGKTVPISAEWFLPNDPRKGYEEYVKLRIPGARFFDLDAIKDPVSPYPHMLPTAEVFAEAMSDLGISREDTVVIYDSPSLGIFSAPRAAWTFKIFGHPKVHLLNNFKEWVDSGLPTESGTEGIKLPKTQYPTVQPDSQGVASFEEIRDLAKSDANGTSVQIIDARPRGRWMGTDPEPRPGLPSGHIPKSISLPFSQLLDPTTKKLLPADELRKILLDSGVNPSDTVQKDLMCGTGVTAVVIYAALEQAGIGGKKRVYDGSWTEWAQRVDEKSGLIQKS